MLLRHLIWAGLERGLPLQFHIGYGDPDLDLRRSDPLLLRGLIELAEPPAVPLLLLHCYPFHRHAGYLAQVYPHVYFDVGLGVSYTGARSARRRGREPGAGAVRQDPLLLRRLGARRAAPPRAPCCGGARWPACSAGFVADGEWT